MTFTIFLILCTLVTWILCHAYRRVAFRAELLAHPNERSAHDSPTPTGAGIIFIAVWIVGLIGVEGGIRYVDPAWLGPIAAAVIGFIDDRRDLPWTVRAPAYAIACAWSIAAVGFPDLNVSGYMVDLAAFGYVFGFLSLLWLMNLYNFMDGIDGIAVGEAIFVLGGAWAIGDRLPMPVLLLLVVCIGFALINWPKAKVFMGDAGASFLGLALGVLTLAEVGVSVWAWVILLGWFLTDASLTICVRAVRGEPIHEAHNLHAYQHLARRFGAPQALYGVMVVNVLWLLPIAWAAELHPDFAAWLLPIAFAPLLIGQLAIGAGRR